MLLMIILDIPNLSLERIDFGSYPFYYTHNLRSISTSYTVFIYFIDAVSLLAVVMKKSK